MQKEINNSEKKEPIFPEESGLIIEKILEKYGLIGNEEEENKKIIKLLKDTKKKNEEILGFLENLPQAKTARLVREYGENKISLDKISSRLKNDLNINEYKAEKITKELKDGLLDSIQIVKTDKEIKKIKVPPVEIREEKTKIKNITDLPKETKNITQEDVYREPLD